MRCDNWLIDNVFQPFAHWFQRMTGKDNFYLSLLSLVTCIFATMCLDVIENNTFVSYSYHLITYIIMFLFLSICESKYKQKNRDCDILTCNTLRKDCAVELMRFILTAFVFISSIIIIFSICFSNKTDVLHITKLLLRQSISVLLDCYIYFIVCTPLPPQKGKIGQTIKALGNALKNALPKPGGLILAPSPT